MAFRSLLALITIMVCVSCTTTPVAEAPKRDLGLLWVKHAAEYEAVSRQVYQAAGLALEDFVKDQSWSALPGQEDTEGLRPAIILDVDGTVVSGVDFQFTYERPFRNWKHNEWSANNPATPVPGFKQFATAARDAGVELFFLTNRPCELIDGIDDVCPQKNTTLDDIAEAGIDTDADHVMLSETPEGWTREKLMRRELVAKTHRIIMLFGDDLSDFVPCVRKKPAAPCSESATKESRRQAVEQYSKYWGNGWYVLPNPMHGSWTTVL